MSKKIIKIVSLAAAAALGTTIITTAVMAQQGETQPPAETKTVEQEIPGVFQIGIG